MRGRPRMEEGCFSNFEEPGWSRDVDQWREKSVLMGDDGDGKEKGKSMVDDGCGFYSYEEKEQHLHAKVIGGVVNSNITDSGKEENGRILLETQEILRARAIGEGDQEGFNGVEKQLGMFPMRKQEEKQSNYSKENSSSRVLELQTKPRMKWNPELHDRFVEAVNELGGAQKAKPKELMNVLNFEGLTLLQVKSHLQKYRQSLGIRREWKQTRETGRMTSSSVDTSRSEQLSPSKGSNNGVYKSYKRKTEDRGELYLQLQGAKFWKTCEESLQLANRYRNQYLGQSIYGNDAVQAQRYKNQYLGQSIYGNVASRVGIQSTMNPFLTCQQYSTPSYYTLDNVKSCLKLQNQLGSPMSTHRFDIGPNTCRGPQGTPQSFETPNQNRAFSFQPQTETYSSQLQKTVEICNFYLRNGTYGLQSQNGYYSSKLQTEADYNFQFQDEVFSYLPKKLDSLAKSDFSSANANPSETSFGEKLSEALAFLENADLTSLIEDFEEANGTDLNYANPAQEDINRDLI